MSCILHIETSTSACSVAVSEDGQNVFKKEDLNGPSHAVSLGIFVDEALSFADSHAMPLDAVAVSVLCLFSFSHLRWRNCANAWWGAEQMLPK